MLRRFCLICLFVVIVVFVSATQRPAYAQNDSGWFATYYSGLLLRGSTVREVLPGTHLKRYWGFGPPHARMQANFFSAQFTRRFETAEPTRQRIVSIGDDGYRIFVDGRLIVNQVSGVPMQRVVTEFDLPPGPHVIYVDYYEMVGNAAIDVQLYEIGRKPPIPKPPSDTVRRNLFEMTPNPATQGDSVTIRWDFPNAEMVEIINYVPRIRALEPVVVYLGPEARGQTTYTLDNSNMVASAEFEITASNSTDTLNFTDVLPLICTNPWAFGTNPLGLCPNTPATPITYQQHRFERGIIMSELPYFGFPIIGSGRTIGSLQLQVNGTAAGNTPASPGLHPPAGLFVPEGPLGEAWRIDANTQQALGWALTRQPETVSTFVQTTFASDTFYVYFGAWNGQVWQHDQRAFTLALRNFE